MIDETFLARLDMALEDHFELCARRLAERRRLFLAECDRDDAQHWERSAEIHVLDPSTWRCLAVCRTWRETHCMLDSLTGAWMARLVRKAKPCAKHPTQPKETP